MTPGGRQLLQAFYWRLRRNRADAAHMLWVLARAACHAIRLAGTGRPSVAIVALERMGDIVAAEPLARRARQAFPDASICWIVRPPHVPLPRAYPEVDRVVAVACLTEWVFLQRLHRFDAVWNTHYNGYGCPRCCLARDDPGLPHQGDYYARGTLFDVQCLCAGLAAQDDDPRLVPPPAAIAAIDALALPQPFVVLHAASLDPQREWAADKWPALVEKILAADPAARVVEVGTRPLALREDGARRRALCGLSVLETAEVIRRAALFVGIDSGPAHLAHAVATPAVLLLGHFFAFSRYMPFSGGYADGTRATILHADGPTATLTVDEVFAAVAARL